MKDRKNNDLNSNPKPFYEEVWRWFKKNVVDPFVQVDQSPGIKQQKNKLSATSPSSKSVKPKIIQNLPVNSTNILSKPLSVANKIETEISTELIRAITANIEALKFLIPLVQEYQSIELKKHGKDLQNKKILKNSTDKVNIIIQRLLTFAKNLPPSDINYHQQIDSAIIKATEIVDPTFITIDKKLNLSAHEKRALAASEGLPPNLAIATQISTRIMGNTVAYRSNGPIAAVLYYLIQKGRARPRPISGQARPSNIGLQAGFVTKDFRNGCYDRDKLTGKYQLTRQEELEPGTQEQVLKIPLRKLFNELGTKFQLIQGENPDQQGYLRFCQVDHECPQVRAIIYSVQINKEKILRPKIKASYDSVANYFIQLGKSPSTSSPFFGIDLDVLHKVYVQHPDDLIPQPLIVFDNMIRDCVVEYMTDPPLIKMNDIFGLTHAECKAYLIPVEMRPQLTSTLSEDEKLSEVTSCNQAKVSMINMLLSLHKKKWDKFSKMKKLAETNLGRSFTLEELIVWEDDNALSRPFIPQQIDMEALAAMVLTIGIGTAMQLYQTFEINFIEQKITASRCAKRGNRLIMADFDDPSKFNSALMTIHKQPIKYLQNTAFVQRPNESNNAYYLSPRVQNIMVAGDIIKIVDDKESTDYVLRENQYLPINMQWISVDSEENSNAQVWIKYMLAQSNSHYSTDLDNPHYEENIARIDEINQFLVDPKNNKFITALLEDFKSRPYAKDVIATKAYFTKFFDFSENIVTQRKFFNSH